MSPRLTPPDLRERADAARALSAPCRLCPRSCGVDRVAGEQGYCGAGFLPQVAAIVPHFGEEPPLCGEGGAGTIFFSRCNLRCVYCQNHQISQGGVGRLIETPELGEGMLELQARGCSTVEPVSPSHHLPGFLEALAYAADKGLNLPVVYNTNGYESPETLQLLDGIVDIYLPDLKYAHEDKAKELSDASDYVETARGAILQMFDQVGNLVVDMNGRAVRGTIIRHLILPSQAAGTDETLAWIADNFPLTVTISLMAQFSPLHRSASYPHLNRVLSADEYERAVDRAWDLGLENVFVQELESKDLGVPDFDRINPFAWD